MDQRADGMRDRRPNLSLDPPRLQTGLVYDLGEVPLRRPDLLRDPRPGGGRNRARDAYVAELAPLLVCYRRSSRARARASSIFDASFPAPCALSDRPPPLPPTIGAISWI